MNTPMLHGFCFFTDTLSESPWSHSCLSLRPEFSEVSNGSSSMQESAVGGSMLSLTNKTSALSLSSDPGASGSEMQKNGVVRSCS